MGRINEVPEPIINLPFEEPRYYYHIEEGKLPEKREGRRPASYFFRVPERAARGRRPKQQVELFEEEAEGQEYRLDNANLIRQRLKDWEQRNYDGITRVTRELLELWQRDDRRQRLFFAQLEAAKTIIFLTEGPQDLRQGIDLPLDEPAASAKHQGYKAFVRNALKMATGTGKTTVMGMLAAWSILNKINHPQDKRYSDTVLILCPNVTIRERLGELDPKWDEASLYRTRELVPVHRMPELRRGEVIITNWHNLERRELNTVNGQSAKVVKRGVPVTRVVTKTVGGEKVEIEETTYYESDQAFINRILGKGRGRSQSILVFNDEAHHAYRRGDAPDEDEIVLDKTTAKKNDREATVWIEGLDRINKVRGGKSNGIRLCVDFSATPFYIQGSGNEVGRPFPWVVSDFSLLEAIESGLVKVPQLPTQDITGAQTPSYFNIWRWVEAVAGEEGHTGALTPDVVLRYATQPILQLAGEWEKTFAVWKEHYSQGLRRYDVPPVFIIVCRDTALAKAVYNWLANGGSEFGSAPPLFKNQPGEAVTVRIDSKVAEDIEAGKGSDEEKRLRFVLDTVGKTEWLGGRVPEEYSLLVHKHNEKAADDGNLQWIDETIPPGRNIRCIISVAMLSEGWDATTVTHIVGLRPFGSQLLCEQVVGRALRRTSYVVDEETGLFREETAIVFGVPFELIPFKTSEGDGQPPTPPSNHIYALPERDRFEISFPVVEGYQDPGVTHLELDWERVPTIVLDPLEVPDESLVKGLSSEDGRLSAYGPGVAEIVNMEQWRSNVRTQQVAFALANDLTRRWIVENGDAIPSHTLFPLFLAETRRFLASDKVNCKGNRQVVDIAANPYYSRAIEALYSATNATNAEGESTELPVIAKGSAGIWSTAHVDFYTGRDLWPVTRCHLNAIVTDTKQWEQSAAFVLDTHKGTSSWVKNDHLGFVVPYSKAGSRKPYIPDFIVRLTTGLMLILEVKGKVGDAELKEAGALRWVNAVNRDGRFGKWTYSIAYHPGDTTQIIDELLEQSVSKEVAMFHDVESTAVRALLMGAYQWAESKRSQGWEQKDFAERLSEFLKSDGTGKDFS
jgi:type III restriction enzyme